MIITLRHGDSFDVLEQMEEGSIAACVCDPPYGISFMGKGWDNLSSSEQMQAWHTEWVRRVHRVLKPGGVIKAFSASRTFHRLAAAMEDAGFNDIQLEAWAYGCLTDEAEILTENGWVNGLDVREGDQVACWDHESGHITLDAVQEVIRAPFDGEMVVFRNHNTNQVLTPNHRVYKKHRIREMIDGKRVASIEETWSVQQAGLIDRWNNITLPLAGTHHGPGIGGVEWARLLGWVWTEGGYDNTGTGVRLYQSSVNMENVNRIQALLDEQAPDHKLYTRERTYKDRVYTEYTWFFTGEVAQRVRATLPEKRPTWDLLWSMSLEEKHAFVEAALLGDGSCNRGRWAFYQKNTDDLVWFQTLAHLMDRQGRVNFEKKSVGLHMNPTTQLQGRHLKDASEHYEGEVWCVRVPTGAFVARYKDQVFITGNSGFPKSLNVSKALDKMHGAKRGTVKTPFSGNGMLRAGGQNTRPWMEEALKKGYHEAPGDTPVTDDAKLWDGWGTALKPAWEPFVVGYKR